jgi:hypothetical protein
VIPCRRGMVAVPAPASPPRIWRESRRAINNQGTTSIVPQASLRLSQSFPVQSLHRRQLSNTKFCEESECRRPGPSCKLLRCLLLAAGGDFRHSL